MIQVIVAFPKKETGLKIKNILTRNGFEVTSVCVTGAQVMRTVNDHEAGIIISGIRYRDMVCNELKRNLPDFFEMIVVANRSWWEEYGDEEVVWLPLPVKGYDLVSTVSDLLADLSRRMKKRRQIKKRSSQEEGLIRLAKERLMEQKQMTEEEAHHYLQKISMDGGNNLVDTAYMVLKLYKTRHK